MGGRGRGRGIIEDGAQNNGPSAEMRVPTAGVTDEPQESQGTKTTHDAYTETSKEINPVVPPDPPSLLPQRASGSLFGVQKQAANTRQELKLSIEFP